MSSDIDCHYSQHVLGMTRPYYVMYAAPAKLISCCRRRR